MRNVVSVLAMALAGLSASATDAQTVSKGIAGAWRFQSAPFDIDCVMSGSVKFIPAQAKAQMACALVVDTQCGAGKNIHEVWRVKQSCTAKIDGDRVRITSKIDRVEMAMRGNQPISVSEKSRYRPEMFDLTLEKSGDEMNGIHFDTIRQLKSRFWRDADLVG
jgi:hypothetical protein